MFLKKIAAVFVVVFVVGCAAAVKTGSINMDEGLGIKGYDPVAYFVAGKPMKGREDITVKWDGITYRFANYVNRKKFQKNPKRYLPQYGGFCAFGMAQNQKIDVDPLAWEVSDGKLYLNYTKKTHEVWKLNQQDNIKEANQNWMVLQYK